VPTKDNPGGLCAELVRPLSASWWTLVAGVCLGLAAGFVGLQYVPSVYRANATLVMNASGGSDSALFEAARSDDLLVRLAASLGHPAPREQIRNLRGRISVTPAQSTGQYDLVVHGNDPQEASLVANRLGDLLAGSLAPVTLAGRAVAPTRPIGPGALRVYSLGLAVGLTIFVGPLLVRSAVNPVICSPAALRGLADAPVLVGIPRIRTRETREGQRRQFLLNVFLSFMSVIGLAVAVVTAWAG